VRALRFVDCVTRYVGADEARHVAFGVLYLKRRWPELPAPERDALRAHAKRWSALLDAVLLDVSSELETLGLDAADLTARARQTRHRHLTAVGIEVPGDG
jgi:hypothetical protein